MICKHCRDGSHGPCIAANGQSSTFCDCQHGQNGVNWKLVQHPESVVVSPTTKVVDCL